MSQIRDHVKMNVATMEAEELSNAKGGMTVVNDLRFLATWTTREVFSRCDKKDFILDNRKLKLI